MIEPLLPDVLWQASMDIYFLYYWFCTCFGQQFSLIVVIHHLLRLHIFPPCLPAPLAESLNEFICCTVHVLIEILSLKEDALVDWIPRNRLRVFGAVFDSERHVILLMFVC